MPGKRGILSQQDNNCLKCFFDQKEHDQNENTYFKLRDRRLSTTEVAKQLKERSDRTKKRLEKLEKIGFIKKFEKKKGTRIDSFWYLTHTSLYYIFSMINGNLKRKKFIVTNEAKSHLVLILKNNVNMNHLDIFLKKIKECARNYEYKKIMDVIKDFFKEIETRYVDWDLNLEPNSRTEIFNHNTGKYELF